MDLQAAMLDAARHRTGATTSVSQGQPPRPQQLGVGDRRRRLPPRPPPPPSRGDTRSSGVGKADEVRGTRDTSRGSGVAVATREAAPAPVAAGAAAVAARDAAPGVARPDKGKGVAELGGKRCLDLAEEKRGGDAERKRSLGLAAYPPLKRRLVSATRRFPPGYGRDAAAPLAAADDDSRLGVASGHGASDALNKTARPLSVESSTVLVFAPIADGGHHGLEAELQRSSETFCRSDVPNVAGLLDTDSQGDAGSAGFVRKELVPATRRLLPKPRMVSAIRRFPPGCGRARVASLVAGGGSTEVGLPLPEKVVATDCSTFAEEQQAMQIAAVPCYATSTDRAAQKEEFVEGEIAAPKVHPQGSQSCTNVTLHEPAACRDGPSVPATSLQSQEKRPSCVVAKDIKVVKSSGSSSNALAQSLAEGPSKKNLVSAKMGTAISGVAPGASGQGAMRRDKVMSAPRKEVRPAKSIQKSAPGSHPSPRPFSKIKEKETEHGRCVTMNDSEDTAGFAKRRVVQASTSGNKCLRTDREAAATSSNSFGPKNKGNVKQKSMLPSNVEDDILKALAAHEEKYGAQNVDARSKVKMMRRRFEFIRRAIIRAVKQQSLKLPRIDLAAADLIKKTPGCTQHGPIVGNVLGIEVGDEFLYRVELNIVGLHRPYQGGIDTTRDKYNELIAISVVASGGYPDQLSRSGELVYTGSGGKVSGKKGEGDQKLVRGNLALKNCIRTKTPVRVIHSFKGLYQEEGNHSSAKEASMFTYDGLYNVVDCWREGQPGSKVFKYKLQKIPGQLHYGSENSPQM